MDEFLFLREEVLPAFIKGTRMSALLIVPSAVLGTVIGVLAGSVRVYGHRLAARAFDAYVALFRGVPLVVQLFIWYFGLPHLGIYLSPYAASVLGFSLCSGAYQSEYIRGALLSIKRGQNLAAQALGFSTFQMVRSIILPQAFRRALPGCGNEIIYLIKYSSLAYMVTCIELTGEAKILASHSFKYLEVFFTVGAFYLAMVTVAGWVLHHLEDRLSLPGFERRRAQ
ncbi:MAG: amino acid ABC transporter permease [Syntrophobacteraceae bacterium]